MQDMIKIVPRLSSLWRRQHHDYGYSKCNTSKSWPSEWAVFYVPVNTV